MCGQVLPVAQSNMVRLQSQPNSMQVMNRQNPQNTDTSQISFSANQNKQYQENGSSALPWVLGAAALLGLTIAAFHPRTRFMAKNLIGEKGIDKFLSNNNIPEEFRNVIAKIKDIPGFADATKGISASNLRKMAETMKGNEGLYAELLKGKIILGADTAEATLKEKPIIDLTTDKDYNLFRLLHRNGKDIVEQFAWLEKEVERPIVGIHYDVSGKDKLVKALSPEPGSTNYILSDGVEMPWEYFPLAVREKALKESAKTVRLTRIEN